MSLMGQYKSMDNVRNQYSAMRDDFWLLLLTLVMAIGFAEIQSNCCAADTNGITPALHAQRAYIAAKRHFESEPTNNAALLELVRAGFDRAEFATNNTEREAIAVPCISASRTLVARDANSAAAHYYLGMNLGQLARTKMLGALRIVDEMEREFKTAAALDEKFDHAGPNRNLGMLYHEAPVIGSIGSRSKARKNFERAAELAPDYPENRLNLAEAYLKWREKKPLQHELEGLEKIWPAARTNFTGIEWEMAWRDWQNRRDKLNAKAKDFLK
jgi:hypothetical protein